MTYAEMLDHIEAMPFYGFYIKQIDPGVVAQEKWVIGWKCANGHIGASHSSPEMAILTCVRWINQAAAQAKIKAIQ